MTGQNYTKLIIGTLGTEVDSKNYCQQGMPASIVSHLHGEPSVVNI